MKIFSREIIDIVKNLSEAKKASYRKNIYRFLISKKAKDIDTIITQIYY